MQLLSPPLIGKQSFTYSIMHCDGETVTSISSINEPWGACGEAAQKTERGLFYLLPITAMPQKINDILQD